MLGGLRLLRLGRPSASSLGAAATLEQISGQRRGDVGPPGGDRFDAADDLGDGAVLEDSLSPEVHRGVKKVFLAVDREEDDFDREAQFRDLSGGAEAVQFRHVHVEDGDGGFQLLNQRDGRRAVVGFGHDGELRVAFDHLPESSAHNRVVVGDHDADFIAHGARSINNLMMMVVPSPGGVNISLPAEQLCALRDTNQSEAAA